MSKYWRWALICYPLLLLNAMIAFVYAVVWCRARSWEWRDGVLTFVAGIKKDAYGRETGRMVGNPGGQGWSWVVGFATEAHRERADLRVHEYTHVVQEFVCSLIGAALGVGLALLGPWSVGLLVAGLGGGALFALAYGMLFVYYLVTEQKDEEPGWRDDYRRNPFERQAYRVEARFQSGQIQDAWGSGN